MRLIDADALKSDFDQEIDYDHFGITYVINEQPTIELPIKRGEWIFRCVAGEDPYECSVCGNSVNVYGYSFCPNCGADMRAE